MMWDVAVWLFAGLAVASLLYSLAVIWAVFEYRAQMRWHEPDEFPPVSILKPLCGADPQLYDNLLSHLRQEYPDYEMVCGAADADDPAREVVQRLAREFPDKRISFSATGIAQRGNPKVAVLERLAAVAKHDVLVLSDADIRVPRDYLRTLWSELRAPGVGLVTCLYGAESGRGAAAAVDRLWVTAEFPGQVLLARALQGVRFGLGATLALRTDDLAAIGGFEAIRPYLADDYQVGARIAAAGKQVLISRMAVETAMRDASWGDVWRRHLRWSRTIRASRPGGHAGLIVTFGGVWAICLAAAAPAWTPLAALCLVTRLGAATAVAGLALRSGSWTRAWLTPLLDCWSLVVYLASFTSKTVDWRGRRLSLDSQGRIL